MEKFLSTAKVIDGTLILTLADAVRPVVWQMQLGQTKSSALEVRDQADGTWMLVLKTPRADVMDIAPFSNKDAAVRALVAVSRALENANGHLPGGTPNGYRVPAVIGQDSSSWLGRIMKFILYSFMTLVVLSVLAILLYLFISASQNEPVADIAPIAAPSTSTAIAPAGAPVSADDFLNDR